MTTSLSHDSQLSYDETTRLLSRWESISVMSSHPSASALTEFNSLNCGGNTQIQARLRYRINQGSWRVSWSVEQQGEPDEDHPNQECEMILGPGDDDFWMNPTMTAGTNVSGTDSSSLASGGHAIAVDFERVVQGPSSR